MQDSLWQSVLRSARDDSRVEVRAFNGRYLVQWRRFVRYGLWLLAFRRQSIILIPNMQRILPYCTRRLSLEITRYRKASPLNADSSYMEFLTLIRHLDFQYHYLSRLRKLDSTYFTKNILLKLSLYKKLN